eukprot:scaffold378578_cov50-Prasinocladus_malaysianus.AAC.2
MGGSSASGSEFGSSSSSGGWDDDHDAANVLTDWPAVGNDQPDSTSATDAACPAGADEICGVILAGVEAIAGESVQNDTPFSAAGIDSLSTSELQQYLKMQLDLDLPATVFFDFPSAKALAEHISTKLSSKTSSKPDVQSLILASLEEIVGNAVPVDEVFSNVGIDSLSAADLRDSLNSNLGMSLPATALFDYPTAATLAVYIESTMEQQSGIDQGQQQSDI